MVKKTSKRETREVEVYTHADKKRSNNPPAGLVTPDSDPGDEAAKYEYDPTLSPQLQWAGKAEHTSFEVPVVSLHVHERIEPSTILRAVRKKGVTVSTTLNFFEAADQKLSPAKALEFYKHPQGWTNRLVAGDSLLVMNSLLEKEAMAGKVQMVYFDPPYGIEFKSNGQPLVGKRDVAEADRDEDLEQAPENIKAFRDTWELGLHSYLAFIRDRMKLAHALLAKTGSVFVQISDANHHHVREVLEEVFGSECYVVSIPFKKKGSQRSGLMRPVNDYLIWFTKSPKDSGIPRFHPLFESWPLDYDTLAEFRYVARPGKPDIPLSELKRPNGEEVDYRLQPALLKADYPEARLFRANPLKSGGERPNQSLPYKFQGRTFEPGTGNSWKHTARSTDGTPSGLDRLAKAGRLIATKSDLRFKSFLDDFGYKPLSNWWDGLGGASNPIYVVQTNTEVVKRCMLMTTDPGDLVLDITCGSGTSAVVAEEWGRRWITCDTSRVAVALAKSRMMTSTYPYFALQSPGSGVTSGFRYKTVRHITSTSIANDEPPGEETLYDQPVAESDKVRITGPFTVEAVPSPVVRPLDGSGPNAEGQELARTGPTRRDGDWRDELQRTGIRGQRGQQMRFHHLEPFAGGHFVHAVGESDDSKQVAVTFGPEFHPLPPNQVELALKEARKLDPKPDILIFAAFEFDPVAAETIDEMNPKVAGMALARAKMNADLLTGELKRKRSSNESFFFIGQPDVVLKQQKDGPGKGKWIVEVKGYDYYDVKEGKLVSGDSRKIAMWMLDTDYDDRSLYPHQVFFPMKDENRDWTRLARNLRAEINEDLIEKYAGTVSIPFELGKNEKVAVKIVDDRGIESVKVLAP